MSGFARRIRGLQRVFPSSGMDILQPNELSETVSPVFQFPPKAASIERAKTVLANSLDVLTPNIIMGLTKGSLLSDPEPSLTAGSGLPGLEDGYIEIFAGTIFHNSGTARQIVGSILDTAVGNKLRLAKWSGFLGTQTPGQPSGFEPLFGNPAYVGATSDRIPFVRPLIIPPNNFLVFDGDTAAFTYVITLLLHYIVHPLVEEPFFT